VWTVCGCDRLVPKFSRTLDTLWPIDYQKIANSDATDCHILRPKCTKFHVRWAPPQTPLRELTAPPDPLVVLKGLFVRGEGDERKGRERPGTPNILA